MQFDKFVLKIAELVTAQNEVKPILEGLEPPVVIIRRELGIEIPIKDIELANGSVRIVI